MRLILLMIAAALPAAVHAQTRPDSAGAVAAVEQFRAAIAAGDSARAVDLLSDDVLIMESGDIQTRREYLGSHLAADIKASRQRPDQPEARTILQVRVLGDMAYVVTRTATRSTGAQGNAGSESAELMVLSRSQGSWRIRVVHWSSRRRRA